MTMVKEESPDHESSYFEINQNLPIEEEVQQCKSSLQANDALIDLDVQEGQRTFNQTELDAHKTVRASLESDLKPAAPGTMRDSALSPNFMKESYDFRTEKTEE